MCTACGSSEESWKYNGGNPWIICAGCGIKKRDAKVNYPILEEEDASPRSA